MVGPCLAMKRCDLEMKGTSGDRELAPEAAKRVWKKADLRDDGVWS